MALVNHHFGIPQEKTSSFPGTTSLQISMFSVGFESLSGQITPGTSPGSGGDGSFAGPRAAAGFRALRAHALATRA